MISVSMRTFSRTLIFTSIFVSSVSVLGMEEKGFFRNNNNNNNNASYTPIHHFHEQESSFDFPQDMDTNSNLNKYSMNFTKDDISEMNFVYETAPKRAKRIVKRLQNRKSVRKNSYPAVIFWGTPGTGKTTTAKAIAYQMQRDANWRCYFISSGSLVKKHRNATAEALEQIFNEITLDKSPFMLLVDEFNELLENTESKKHDTSATAKRICKFLDDQKNNPYFFFIGTANRIAKLDEAFKHRVKGKCINFTLLLNPAIKIAIFKAMMKDDATKIDDNISDDQLGQALSPINDCAGRDLTNLADLCIEVFLDENEESKEIIIRINHITQAVQEYLQAREDLKYGQKQETDEERQERYHRVQCDQFETGQALQVRLSRQQYNQAAEQFALAQQAQEQLSDAQLDLQRIHFERGQAEGRRLFNLQQEEQRRLHTEQLNQQTRISNDQNQHQQELFVRGLRAQAYQSTNNIGLGIGNGAGASVNNIGMKDHLFNYVLSEDQRAINERIEQETAGRPTSLIGSGFRTALNFVATRPQTVRPQQARPRTATQPVQTTPQNNPQQDQPQQAPQQAQLQAAQQPVEVAPQNNRQQAPEPAQQNQAQLQQQSSQTAAITEQKTSSFCIIC